VTVRADTDRADAIAIASVVALFAVAYSAYGVARHWHFGSSAYDLGIFDQVVWHLSRFEAPASSLRGFTNMFGDHFSPIVIAWAPLYWVAPFPETLIVAQAVLFAASIVPVFLFASDLVQKRTAYALAIAYGLFWGLQRAMAFDVHEIAFAPLTIATAVLAVHRRWWGLFWTCMVGLALTKEDLIPLIGGFGLYLAILGERRRAVAAVAASIVLFVAVVGVIVPTLNPAGVYGYASSFTDVLERPWLLPKIMITPVTKLYTAMLWLLPFLFASVASWLSILIGLLAVERFLSESPNHWGTSFHYSAPLAPLVVMSAADGLGRISLWLRAAVGPERSARFIWRASIAMVVLASVLPGRQPLWRVLSPGHYRAAPADAGGFTALDTIPPDASVVAQAAIAPHLSHRSMIFVLSEQAPDADYVIAAAHLSPWPLATQAELTGIVDRRLSAGYSMIFNRDGWRVLQRTSEATPR
jgi:uncharacterized membrane protein